MNQSATWNDLTDHLEGVERVREGMKRIRLQEREEQVGRLGGSGAGAAMGLEGLMEMEGFSREEMAAIDVMIGFRRKGS